PSRDRPVLLNFPALATLRRRFEFCIFSARLPAIVRSSRFFASTRQFTGEHRRHGSEKDGQGTTQARKKKTPQSRQNSTSQRLMPCQSCADDRGAVGGLSVPVA